MIDRKYEFPEYLIDEFSPEKLLDGDDPKKNAFFIKQQKKELKDAYTYAEKFILNKPLKLLTTRELLKHTRALHRISAKTLYAYNGGGQSGCSRRQNILTIRETPLENGAYHTR